MSGDLRAGDLRSRCLRAGMTPVPLPAGVEFAPQSWDASAVGGPGFGVCVGNGGEEALGELADWLGCSLWIVSPEGSMFGTGTLPRCSLMWGRVAGCDAGAGGEQGQGGLYGQRAGGDLAAAETTWAENTASIGRFGLRERMMTAQGPMRAAQAEKMRDTLLNKVSRPSPLTGRVGPSSGVAQATLVCRGWWWARLEDVYYAQDNGRLEYTEGSLAHPLGLGFTSNRVAGSSRDKRFALHEIDGKFKGFALEGLQVKVTGMPNGGNNKVHTVESGDAKEPVTLGASNIMFDPRTIFGNRRLRGVWGF